MILSRRAIRQLSRLVAVVCCAIGLVLLCDWFFDILPGKVQKQLPKAFSYHASHPAMIVTDLKVEVCFSESRCREKETESWKMLPKDIKVGASSWTSLAKSYMYYNQSETISAEELVIVDITCNRTELVDKVKQLSTTDKAEDQITDADIVLLGWEQVKNTNAWVHKDIFNAKKDRIMGVEILYGSDAVDPRANWAVLPGNLIDLDNTEVVPRLSVYQAHQDSIPQGEHKSDVKDKLRVNSNGKFKVMQIADLHYGNGPGQGLCRDSAGDIAHISRAECRADTETRIFVESVLDLEKPDMVVLSGDQLFGEAALDQVSAYYKAVEPLEKRKIPYAVIWGNHDEDAGTPLDRAHMSALASSLDHSLFESGPEDVDGYGNYKVSVKAARSNYPALTFYFADSHGRQNTKSGNPPYLPLTDKQLEHLKALNTEEKTAQKGYSHIPLSMAFIHVPFMEFRFISNMVGEAREGVACARTGDARDVFASMGVSIVACGHDHTNDYCGVNEKDDTGIWLCYGGAVGERGYAGHDYTRRLRLYEFDTQSGSITTWKRLHDMILERTDEQTLVKGGELVYEKS